MWYIEMGGSKNGYFTRKIYIEDKDVSKIRKDFNNTDVYMTIYHYNSDDQNESDIYGPLYIDLDLDLKNDEEFLKIKNDLIKVVVHLETLFGIKSNQIKYYFSGNKGFHLIVSPTIFNLSPRKNLNTIYKKIALVLKDITMFESVDTKIYDKKRLFRLPNSINSKTGLYKVPITFDDILKFDFKQMKEYASSPKDNIEVTPVKIDKAINKINDMIKEIEAPKEKSNSNFNIKEIDMNQVKLPDCIMQILTDGALEGNRNNTTVILASALFQQGAKYKDTMELMQEWNDKKNEPSLPEMEISITVASAYQLIKSGRGYGCSSIRDCGLCIGKECRIFK